MFVIIVRFFTFMFHKIV